MAAAKKITEPGRRARLPAAPPVRLAPLQDISRLSGKWSSMLTFWTGADVQGNGRSRKSFGVYSSEMEEKLTLVDRGPLLSLQSTLRHKSSCITRKNWVNRNDFKSCCRWQYRVNKELFAVHHSAPCTWWDVHSNTGWYSTGITIVTSQGQGLSEISGSRFDGDKGRNKDFNCDHTVFRDIIHRCGGISILSI